MSRPLITALAAGVLGGLMIAAPGLLGPAGIALFLFALVPTFAVGLSQGLPGALYAFAAATVTTAAVGKPLLAVGYVVLFAVPQAWLTRQALLSRDTEVGVQWYPAGRLLAWLIGIAAVFVAAAMLLFAGTEGGLVGSLENDFHQALTSMAGLGPWPLSSAEIGRLAPELAAIAPAALANLWILLMVGNGILAQALVVRGGHNLRPTAPFAELELPPGLMYALGAVLVLSLVPGAFGFLGKTVVAVVTVAYFILGLALIHAVTRDVTARRAYLIATYLLIAILQWLTVVVILLGLAEQVFRLRKRFMGAKKGKENE